MRDFRLWISALILFVLSLHAVPLVSYQGHRQTTWPILAWGMYAKSHPPGRIVTFDRFLVSKTAAGRRDTVTPEMVGLTRAPFRNFYLNPLYRADSIIAGELIRRLNRRRADPVVELRTYGTKYTLTHQGVASEQLPALLYRVVPASSR